MNKVTINNNTHIILGFGQSGLSCARYFDRINQSYRILDTREMVSGVEEIIKLTACLSFQFGNLTNSLLDGCVQLVVSPGVSLNTPIVQYALSQGIDVCGDVEIFVRNCHKPIVAITGSNGKSTVTDLTDKLLNSSAIKSQKGGNIGLPVLDFLPEDHADIYVLELSSFQLDTTKSLRAKVAVILNITEDHLDRYNSFDEYAESKHKVYVNADSCIYNYDDQLTYPKNTSIKDKAFSVLVEHANKFPGLSYIKRTKNNFDLMVNNKNILSSEQLKLTGKHNLANVLVSLNILNSLAIEIDNQILNVLKKYEGLAHRFQLVTRKNNCEWINDSKATNVGATIAAIKSISNEKQQLILIAGGDSKQNDLRLLIKPFEQNVNELILLGKDASLLANLTSKVSHHFVKDMKQAVIKAKTLVNGFSIVLLSPACASLDMYKNFEERGNEFINAVRECA